MKYKAIVFDFDNTLSQTNLGFAKLVNWCFLELGFDLDLEEIRGVILKKHHFKDVIDDLCLTYQIDRDEFINLYQNNSEKIKYQKANGLNEIFAFLNDSFGDCKKILVTNRYNLLDLRLSDVGLARDDFDLFVFPRSLDQSKPSSYMMNEVVSFLDGFDIKKSEILSIGDDVVDLVASKKVGFDFWALTTGVCSRDDFLEKGVFDDEILDSLVDVLQKLKFLNGLDKN